MTSAERSSTRVLIVEDSPTQAEALRADLSEAGFVVSVARTGDEGLERFRSERPELVISDILMPGSIDGYELCRRIKREAEAAPVLLLTSLNDPMDIIRGLECGADNFLTKPYDVGLLLERVGVLLTTRRARAQERLSVGVKVVFMGREFTITSEREQILDLLVTTFEEAVRQNRELRKREQQLQHAQTELARYARSLEAQLDRVLRSIPEALFSASPDWHKMHYVSDGVRRVFGCDPEEFTFEYWQERVYPADREGVLRSIERAVERGSIENFEYRFAPHANTIRWIAKTVIPVRNGNGIARIDGIARDITERKQVQQALEESERRLRDILDNSTAVIYLKDLEGRYQIVNRGFLELFGLTRASVRGKTDHDLFPIAVADSLRANDRAVLESGSAMQSEETTPHLEGPRTYLSLKFPLLGADGRPYAVCGMSTDITDRQRVDAAVRRQNVFLNLLQRVTVGVNEAADVSAALQLVVDEVCRHINWPVGHAFVPHATEPGVLVSADIWHGATERELADFRAATSGARLNHDQGLVGLVLASGKPEWCRDLAADCDFQRPAGGVRSAFAVPVFVGKDPVAVLEFFHPKPIEPDVGLLDVMYQIGIQLGRVVERQRAEHQREHHEAQIRQAQKMDAIGRLAGGVAHDFNNLLSVIMGEADLALLDLEETHPLQSTLYEVRRAAERASQLTRQLLAFSRRQLVEPTVFSINDVVRDMQKMLRRLITEDIELTTRCADDLGMVKMDRGQLEQVIVNLVVNARDAMPEGGQVTIQTSGTALQPPFVGHIPGLDPGDYVMLSVSDTGSGMSAEVQSHIFEPFFTTKIDGKGTGLGLATCYGIVRQAGGTITVYSEPGVGTTMRVYLPRTSEQGDVASGGDRPTPMPGGTETVLVVEDEEAVRRVVVRTLQALGYHVLEAKDGPAALDLLDRTPVVRLLYTDIVLPGLRGRELAERARSVHPTLRVLYTSGYTDDVVLQKELLARGAELLQKPVNPRELAFKVRALLDREDARRA